MKIPTISPELIEGLRSRFHPKDRSVYLAANCLAYLSNGAYLSNAFISETILSANAASVTFSNIPQGFRQLMVFAQPRSSVAAEIENVLLRFNADSGSNYDAERLLANGVTASASVTGRATSGSFIGVCEGANSRAANFGGMVVFIPGYQRSDAEKIALGLSMAFGDASADADLFTNFQVLRWRNTNVVTSIVLLPATGPNFVSGSRFQLYGIL